MSEPEFIRVGQIVGAHGLKGQVKVQLFISVADHFVPGTKLRLDDNWVEIKDSQVHKNRLLLRLVGVTDRNAAEALQWKYLEAKHEDVELEEDEYLTEDLIGLNVVTADGTTVGTVDEVLALPAQDVLVIGEVMIPVVKQFVREIDLDKGEIIVTPIPGMLGEDEASPPP